MIAATFVIAGGGFAAGTATAAGAAEGARDTANLEQAEQKINNKLKPPIPGSGNGLPSISGSGQGIPNGPEQDGAQAHGRG
jgi:hypothetical protein